MCAVSVVTGLLVTSTLACNPFFSRSSIVLRALEGLEYSIARTSACPMGAVEDGENKPLQIFVPGRLCLFGEHSDWAGSYRK